MKLGRNHLRRTLTAASYLAPAVIIVCLWVPVIAHYWIADVVISDEALNTARRLPSDQVMNELSGLYLIESQLVPKTLVVLTAEKLLEGDVEMLGYSITRISMPFAPEDLEKGLPGWRLALASLIVPRVLLDAYELTGRDEFIMAAKNVIVAVARHERKTWLPNGMLWNDHAVAERVFVLARFWHLYRNHHDFRPEVAQAVLGFAARSGQLLMKPGHFTFSTNHGVMQNLALFHLSVTFPSLPHAEEYKNTALSRLIDQMDFYVNQEGVVLEHSAVYQAVGLQFMGMAMRYATLVGMEIPGNWIDKYEKAKVVYAQLRRPDGTLPKIGDTGGESVNHGAGVLITDVNAEGNAGELHNHYKWTPKEMHSFWPGAGYSVWWNGLEFWPDHRDLAQTVIAWSNFLGHAHKHADELSVLLWAGGQTWWTNVGYWPDGLPGRLQAISWPGSNAPHLVDEHTNSVRSTRPVYWGETDRLAVIDLERRGESEYVVRRQILHLKPNIWMIVDQISGQDKSHTIWTTAHDVRLTRKETGDWSYCLEEPSHSDSLSSFIIGSSHNTVNVVAGSVRPFAGWEVVDYVNKPAHAIVIEHAPGESWSTMTWVWHKGMIGCGQWTQTPRMVRWSNADDWRLMVPLSSGSVDISRTNNRVAIVDYRENRKAETIELHEVENHIPEIDKLHEAYNRAAEKYTKSNLYLGYRTKLTKILIAFFIIQEMLFLVCKSTSEKLCVRLRGFSAVSWIVGGSLLIGFFDVMVFGYANR